MVAPTLILFCGALTVAFFFARKMRGKKRRESGDVLTYERLCEEVKRKSYYYHQLSEPEKALYLERTWLFFRGKEFLARGFDEVSFHMKTVIASYAAQITFGFDNIRLEHFKTIVIYPSPYQSTVTRQWHKGETHREGAIVFSCKDLKEGHESKNGVNLALHELADYERSRIKHGTHNLLRDYAATNNQEFFAVCIENFFELPRLFKEEAPEMYQLLVHVLQQDLLRNPVRLRL